jgi:hypothetical protein
MNVIPTRFAKIASSFSLIESRISKQEKHHIRNEDLGIFRNLAYIDGCLLPKRASISNPLAQVASYPLQSSLNLVKQCPAIPKYKRYTTFALPPGATKTVK